tara:strand:+ start:244 stop:540 length:297 start_codon:yes stop_codon:yes gene_type:complete
MKVHNASNENASVTLKPAEVEEITTFGFNSLSVLQELLNTIVDVHDNGENCPICGDEYENKDAYIEMVCNNSDCAFTKAQNILDEFPQALRTLKTAFD